MSTIAASIGDNCVDNYLSPVNQRFIGGNALNVAIHMQRSGAPAAYIGVVGDDEYGALVLENLRQQGVDASYVKVLPGKTSRTDIRISAGGDREFILETDGPATSLELDAPTLRFALGHRLVHTTWRGGADSFLPVLHAGSPLVSLDFGERYSQDFIDHTIPYVDLAFFSLPEDQAGEAGKLAHEMKARGPRLVVVTMGSQGSLAHDGQIHTQPAFPVEVVDTLGAGDTYIGTFLGHLLNGALLPVCMQKASYAAALTCTHLGGWS